jgi:hypothetical protein
MFQIPTQLLFVHNDDSCFIRSNLTGISDIIISNSQPHILEHLDSHFQEGKSLFNQINPLPESDILLKKMMEK